MKKEQEEQAKAEEFILQCFNHSKQLTKDDILDKYEITCENRGMTRKQRRQAIRDFDYPLRDAMWALNDKGIIKIGRNFEFTLHKPHRT